MGRISHVPGASARSVGRRQVATRSAFPAASRNVTNTGGTNTQIQQVSAVTLTEDVSDLAFTFGNFHRAAAGSTSFNGLASVTVRLGLWDGVQTYPVFWENGSRDLVLEPGAVATTRPLFFRGRKGQRVWLVRRMTWATAPGFFPASTVPAWTGTQVNEWGTALTDRTTAYGAFFTRSAGNFAVFPPLAITGTAKPGPVVGILGDSIASDGSNDYSNDEPDYGWAMGGLSESGIPYTNLGTASLQSAHILTSKAGRAQLFAALLAAGATHLLYALSTNDWAAGRTAAQLFTDLATLKAELDPLGIKLVPVTSLPKTNAANNGQLAGETATFTQRALFNDTLRAGSGVGYGFFELARVVENPADQNLWRTDVRTSTGITLVSGGIGYKNSDYLRLPGGGGITATTTSGGVITAVGGTPAYGGWLTDPAATVSPLSVVSDDAASQGISVGAGAVLSYTGIVAATSTTDGTHPQPPVTRLMRQAFAAVAPSLFSV